MGRVGIGQDSHRFEKGKDLILGGVKIPDHDGLRANSDGDVVLHSLCNAIASAIGMGSLSTYADDLLKKGIEDSRRYVEHILSKTNLKVINAGISIEAKTPKLEQFLPKMNKEIEKIINAPAGVTVTSGEGLTDFGLGKGIRSTAIVLLGE